MPTPARARVRIAANRLDSNAPISINVPGLAGPGACVGSAAGRSTRTIFHTGKPDGADLLIEGHVVMDTGGDVRARILVLDKHASLSVHSGHLFADMVILYSSEPITCSVGAHVTVSQIVHRAGDYAAFAHDGAGTGGDHVDCVIARGGDDDAGGAAVGDDATWHYEMSDGLSLEDDICNGCCSVDWEENETSDGFDAEGTRGGERLRTRGGALRAGDGDVCRSVDLEAGGGGPALTLRNADGSGECFAQYAHFAGVVHTLGGRQGRFTMRVLVGPAFEHTFPTVAAAADAAFAHACGYDFHMARITPRPLCHTPLVMPVAECIHVYLEDIGECECVSLAQYDALDGMCCSNFDLNASNLDPNAAPFFPLNSEGPGTAAFDTVAPDAACRAFDADAFATGAFDADTFDTGGFDVDTFDIDAFGASAYSPVTAGAIPYDDVTFGTDSHNAIDAGASLYDAVAFGVGSNDAVAFRGGDCGASLEPNVPTGSTIAWATAGDNAADTTYAADGNGDAEGTCTADALDFLQHYVDDSEESYVFACAAWAKILSERMDKHCAYVRLFREYRERCESTQRSGNGGTSSESNVDGDSDEDVDGDAEECMRAAAAALRVLRSEVVTLDALLEYEAQRRRDAWEELLMDESMLEVTRDTMSTP